MPADRLHRPLRARVLPSAPFQRRRLAAFAVALLYLAGCGGEEIEVVGVVERTVLELAAPVSEEVVALPHRAGDAVEADEVLVELRDEVARLEVEAADALARAAEANLAAAEREFTRVEGLARARVAAATQLDAARRTRDEAIALRAERAARAAQARNELADLTVRATRAGVVDQLPYEIGERVPAGGVVAVVLTAEDPWVRVWLPARAVSAVAPGTPAEIEVEGVDGTLEGRVLDVAHESEFTPHYALTERERSHLVYEARIALADAPEGLRPGLPATVRIRLGRRPETGSPGKRAGAGG